ncbi:Lacal_2735 family protein [Lutibacter sp.]|uniref:Lacal_2735 family protein n=1 Tax=Lutibacter sp. TaxID=1925666 RepID=UPI001A281866|nr:Lacal_2735 family protein [Lutibacter sp.]MBI9041834.1 Lacal_2735 family protein [Lutibacter sp.]
MLNIFKKKSKAEKLNDQYKKLLEESYKLSTTNRKLSDRKAAEANEILIQIDLLNPRN